MKNPAAAGAGWLVLLAPLLFAAPAAATKIVQVRIGNHPTFTRVVFELDAAAGYRIENRVLEGGAREIVITVDAASSPRNIASRSVMVERVSVESKADRSVARIRLRKKSPRVKELILASPPRLVFDLMLPEADLVKTAPPPPKTAPAAEAAATQRAAEEKRLAAEKQLGEQKQRAEENRAAEKTRIAEAKRAAEQKRLTEEKRLADEKRAAEQKRLAEEKRSTEQKRIAEQKRLAEEKQLAEQKRLAAENRAAEQKRIAEEKRATEQKRLAEEQRLAEEKRTAEEKRIAEEKRATEQKRLAEEKQLAALKQLAEEKRLEKERQTAELDETPDTVQPPVVKPPAPPAPRPVVTKPVVPLRPEEPGSGWLQWGAVAAGVLAVLIGVVLFVRRRAIPNDLDVTTLADWENEDGTGRSEGFAMGGSEAFDEESDEGEQRTVAEVLASGSSGIAAGPGSFDEPEKGESEMDRESMDVGGASESAGVAGGGSDVTRLVRELERRVAQIETRLDESVDARERLERQVAAQSEELRVQRAAIARTQRALRSLNRSDEEHATEPALRDPNAAGEG